MNIVPISVSDPTPHRLDAHPKHWFSPCAPEAWYEFRKLDDARLAEGKPHLRLSTYIYRYRVFIKYCVFSEDFKIFRTLAFLCFPSVSVCVHTHTRRVEHHSAAAELVEFRKSQNLKEKTQYFMNTLYFTKCPRWRGWAKYRRPPLFCTPMVATI